MNRYLIILITTLTFATNGFSQLKNSRFDNDSKNAKTNPFGVTLNVGSSFTGIYNHNVLGTYVSPAVHYSLSNRLRLSVGMSANTFFIPNAGHSETALQLAQNKALTYSMFAKGEYFVTDNLRLRATGLFGANASNMSQKLTYGNIGFDYKIGRHAVISADINMYNGNMPFMPPHCVGCFGSNFVDRHVADMFFPAAVVR